MLIMQKEFEINKHITLKLEDNVTVIYINGERFNTCKRLLLNIPVEKITTIDEIESIDEAAEKSKGEFVETEKDLIIPPEVEFWAHSSNLQVWVEHDYDTRLLHSTLAFPLLEKLAEIGVPRAKIRFKEEIAQRLESGYPSVIKFLYEEDYVYRYLTPKEILNIILDSNEAFTILELEKLIDKPLIHALNIIEPNSFTIDNKKVSQLNLRSLKVPEIMRNVLNFKFLKRFILNAKEITPENRQISIMPRITFNLDPFNYSVINLLAEKLGKSITGILQDLINQYISDNSESLKSHYGINLEDIRRKFEKIN